MNEVRVTGEPIADDRLEAGLSQWLEGLGHRHSKVLLLPPDITRSHSQAGRIVALLYRMLSSECTVDIMPALGTHAAMTRDEQKKMFGDGIPSGRFLAHDWRNDTCRVGEVPGEYVASVSEGRLRDPIGVEVNRLLVGGDYDLVVSIGQVVPHEVVGMANYSKNVLVGCGGKEMIDKSHFLGALYGMERLMGRDHSPVRQVFDYAEERFLSGVPLQYIMTVTAAQGGDSQLYGLFAGRDRSLFEDAVKLSQKKNLNLLDAPLRKVVVYLDPGEFKSTWLGNKAIYRTRMAIADGGELLIIAPGLRQFGEDPQIDRVIRKYGYAGTERILSLVETQDDLKGNLSAAAHLIHGSSEGRFAVTYSPGFLRPDEIESVHFRYAPLDETLKRYDPARLQNGFNTLADGETVFFVSNPALGLWALKEKF